MKLAVFAYQEIGFVCLEALLEAGGEVALVLTHEDDPGEEIWFRSGGRAGPPARDPRVHPAEPERAGDGPKTFGDPAGFYFFILLPPPAGRGGAEHGPRGGVQPARFAASEIPRPGARQLGAGQRRDRDRGDPAPDVGETGRRTHRGPEKGSHRGNGHRGRPLC